MTDKTTTIQITNDVKARLSKERKFEKESYDNILRRILSIWPFKTVGPKHHAKINILNFEPEDERYQALMKELGVKQIEGYFLVNDDSGQISRDANIKINGMDAHVSISENDMEISITANTQEEMELKLKAIKERYNYEDGDISKY